MSNLPQMVWVDYEGTGVHEEGPVLPLEIGLIITDKAGNELSSFQSLTLMYGWQSAINRAKPIVKEMHTKSGLIDALALASENKDNYRDLSPWKVEERVVAWLNSYFPDKLEKLPLSGSSVHYDRRVAQEHMPDLHKWFHYRNLDISSIKNACQLLNPELYKRLPKDPNKQHRPLADIRASIREFQWYTNEFLIVEGDRW